MSEQSTGAQSTSISDWMTVPEAADLIGITRQSVLEAIHATASGERVMETQQLRAVRQVSRWLVRKDDAQSYRIRPPKRPRVRRRMGVGYGEV